MSNSRKLATASELLDRAKQEVKVVENDQTRVIAKFKMPDDALPDFTEESPTKPKGGHAKVPSIIPRHPGSEPPEPLDFDPDAAEDVVARNERAVEVSGTVQKASVLEEEVQAHRIVLTEPEDLSAALEDPLVPSFTQPARWPKVVLAVLTPAALIVSVLALLRYFGVSL